MNSQRTGSLRRKEDALIILAIVCGSAALAGLIFTSWAGSGASHIVTMGVNKVRALPPVYSPEERGIRGLNYLFGNFSSMTILFDWVSAGSSTSQEISYVVLGTTVDSGQRVYEVNVTGTATGSGQSDTESLLAWVSCANGQIIQTYDSEEGYLAGARAEQENSTLFMFTTMSWLAMMNSTTVSQIVGSQQVLTIGQVSMDVTTFKALSSFTAFPNWTVNVGTIESSGIQLVTSYSFLSSGSRASMQILSLTKAA
jgi:hypothetical protein